MSVVHNSLDNAIYNELEEVPKCTENHTRISECLTKIEGKIDDTKCYPVLVKCSSSSSEDSTNIVLATALSVTAMIVSAGSIVAVVLLILCVRKCKHQKINRYNNYSNTY